MPQLNGLRIFALAITIFYLILSVASPEENTTHFQISYSTWFVVYVILWIYGFIARKLDEMSWKTEAELKKLWLQNQKLISAAEHNGTIANR